jgi:hypothetical protein
VIGELPLSRRLNQNATDAAAAAATLPTPAATLQLWFQIHESRQLQGTAVGLKRLPLQPQRVAGRPE